MEQPEELQPATEAETRAYILRCMDFSDALVEAKQGAFIALPRWPANEYLFVEKGTTTIDCVSDGEGAAFRGIAIDMYEVNEDGRHVLPSLSYHTALGIIIPNYALQSFEIMRGDWAIVLPENVTAFADMELVEQFRTVQRNRA